MKLVKKLMPKTQMPKSYWIIFLLISWMIKLIPSNIKRINDDTDAN
jgi:hypothetical protein